MAFLSALLSLLGQKIGTLLQAIFGWSITGLFGRLPSAKQTALSVAILLSIAWPLLVMGVALPNVAAWALAFVPLQDLIPKMVLRIVWLALAIAAPLVVGAIVRWVAPARTQKGGALRTVISGFPITLGFFVSFLVTLVVVPALKIAAMVRGWTDEHVFVQPREGRYRAVLDAIRDACVRAGVAIEEQAMPKAMSLPTRVLKRFAGTALEAIVAADPRRLVGEGVYLYLYPADLLLRGKPNVVARVRSVLARELLSAPAHLVKDERAQALEDEVDRMWDVVELHRGERIGGLARRRVGEIARELDHLDLPFDEWVLLYLHLHRLERAVCGGPHLVDPTVNVRNERIRSMEVYQPTIDPRPDAPTSQLLREAVDETKELVKLEVELAKTEVREEIAQAKTAAIAAGASVALAILGVAMLLVALALAIFPGPWPAFVIGLVLLAVAAGSALAGYKLVPKKPMDRTKNRVEADVKILKERIA